MILKKDIRLFIIMNLLVMPEIGWSQTANQRLHHVVLSEEAFSRDFFIKQKDHTLFVNKNRDYHWYKANSVLQTQGGQGGKLLHGLYKEYFLNHNLKCRGHLRNGQKIGRWKEWWPNGTIKSSYRYCRGSLSGKMKDYSEFGFLTEKSKFKKGMKSGITLYFDDNKLTSKIKYRRNLPIDTIDIQKPPKFNTVGASPKTSNSIGEPDRKRLKRLLGKIRKDPRKNIEEFQFNESP